MQIWLQDNVLRQETHLRNSSAASFRHLWRLSILDCPLQEPITNWSNKIKVIFLKCFIEIAGNGGIDVSWDIWSYVRPAEGAENEVTAFCFTIYEPTNGQPEDLK